jgi:hypothetical protein
MTRCLCLTQKVVFWRFSALFNILVSLVTRLPTVEANGETSKVKKSRKMNSVALKIHMLKGKLFLSLLCKKKHKRLKEIKVPQKNKFVFKIIDQERLMIEKVAKFM